MTYFGYKFGCELVEIGLTVMANAKSDLLCTKSYF